MSEQRTMQGQEEKTNLIFSGAGFAFKINEETLKKRAEKVRKGKMSTKDLDLFIQKRLKHISRGVISSDVYEEDFQNIVADVREKFDI